LVQAIRDVKASHEVYEREEKYFVRALWHGDRLVKDADRPSDVVAFESKEASVLDGDESYGERVFLLEGAVESFEVKFSSSLRISLSLFEVDSGKSSLYQPRRDLLV